MTKYDAMAKGRSVGRLPGGEWRLDKCDGSRALFVVGPIPKPMTLGWLSLHWKRDVGFRDLQALHSVPLTPDGMLEALARFGPWNRVPSGYLREGETMEGPLFVSWWRDTIAIQRAYSLWNSLRSGRAFDWEVRGSSGLSSYRLLNWPKKLRMRAEFEPCEFLLPFESAEGARRVKVKKEDGHTFRAAFEDEDVARAMAKTLLARYVDQGLRGRQDGIELGFSYDMHTDTFRTDVAENEVLSLRMACWLILRDLAAGVSGKRFCAAPGCTKSIDHKRKGAKVCGNTCQQALVRQRKRARK